MALDNTGAFDIIKYNMEKEPKFNNGPKKKKEGGSKLPELTVESMKGEGAVTNKVHPIKPEDVAVEKQRTIPDEVFSSFNELIAQKWDGHSATIKQDDVVALIVKKGLSKKEISDKGWLDVEDAYRSFGWYVEYDKPGYNESYPATFTFKRKSKS